MSLCSRHDFTLHLRPPPPPLQHQVNPLLGVTCGLQALHALIHRRAAAASSVAPSSAPHEAGAASAAADARLMAAWTSRSLVANSSVGPGGAREEEGAGESGVGGRGGGVGMYEDNGLLPLDDLASLPLLGRRYRVLGLLGEGTFAQIFKCEDTFGNDDDGDSRGVGGGGQGCEGGDGVCQRMVAVKVMNRRFGELGRREAACLEAVHAFGEVGKSRSAKSQ